MTQKLNVIILFVLDLLPEENPGGLMLIKAHKIFVFRVETGGLNVFRQYT